MAWSASFKLQKASSLRNLWLCEEAYSSLPASCGEPKLGLCVEKLQISNFEFQVYCVKIWIIIDQLTCIQIIDLNFSFFKSNDDKLKLRISSSKLRFLFWPNFSIMLASVKHLVLFCNLLISSFKNITAFAFTSAQAPHSDHEIWVNTVINEVNGVYYCSYQCWRLAC